MAKVTFWQPTDVAALPGPQFGGGSSATANSHDMSGSAGGPNSFSLIGDNFAYDNVGSLSSGTLRAAAINTPDADLMPNITIEFPNGLPATPELGADFFSLDFRGALKTLLRENDVIRGSNGVDGIRGFNGNDKISGREGNDTLTGDEGKDKFIFDTKLNAATNVDFITDFEVNKDTIRLDRDIFKKIGDKLNAKEFRAGTKAKDGNDRIIYDDETGTLYHDKNGDKAGKKTVFAFLPTNLALDHKDFDMFG